MKKILVSSVVALCVLGSTSMAEESGMFVGAEVGMGTTAFPGVKKTDFTQVGYGLVVGYKQFFTEDFGLRYYANFNHQLAGAKKNDVLPLDRLNYGFNVDALYNFVNIDSINIGAFLGVGIGANTFIGKNLKTYKESAKTAGKTLKATGLDASLNAGIRTSFAKYHSVELAVRVPFVKTQFFSYTGGKSEAQPKFNASLRYVLTF